MSTTLASRNLKVKDEGAFSYRFITDQKTFVVCALTRNDQVASGVSFVNAKAGDEFDLDRGVRLAFNRAIRSFYWFFDTATVRNILHEFRKARAEQEPKNGVPIVRVMPYNEALIQGATTDEPTQAAPGSSLPTSYITAVVSQ